MWVFILKLASLINCSHAHWRSRFLKEKAVIPHAKSLRQKRPAPWFDLKSVYIIKEWRPFSIEWALKEIISTEKGRPSASSVPSLRGKRGAREFFCVPMFYSIYLVFRVWYFTTLTRNIFTSSYRYLIVYLPPYNKINSVLQIFYSSNYKGVFIQISFA